MPLYEYRCERGHISDAYRPAAERHDPAICQVCHAAAHKIFSVPGFAMPDIAGYKSIVDGRWIGSRSAHRAHLRDNGLIEVGNERLPPRAHQPPGGVREDIYRAIEEVKSR